MAGDCGATASTLPATTAHDEGVPNSMLPDGRRELRPGAAGVNRHVTTPRHVSLIMRIAVG
jgi:hypothetical protein